MQPKKKKKALRTKLESREGKHIAVWTSVDKDRQYLLYYYQSSLPLPLDTILDNSLAGHTTPMFVSYEKETTGKNGRLAPKEDFSHVLFTTDTEEGRRGPTENRYNNNDNEETELPRDHNENTEFTVIFPLGAGFRTEEVNREPH
ncbi:hypothetical protein MHYP_G00122400 [Metynnis hypsauchen]